MSGSAAVAGGLTAAEVRSVAAGGPVVDGRQHAATHQQTPLVLRQTAPEAPLLSWCSESFSEALSTHRARLTQSASGCEVVAVVVEERHRADPVARGPLHPFGVQIQTVGHYATSDRCAAS